MFFYSEAFPNFLSGWDRLRYLNVTLPVPTIYLYCSFPVSTHSSVKISRCQHKSHFPSFLDRELGQK